MQQLRSSTVKYRSKYINIFKKYIEHVNHPTLFYLSPGNYSFSECCYRSVCISKILHKYNHTFCALWGRDSGFFPPLSVYMEKEMATHSSILAWKIPWMEEPGGLQSMGSLRVGHDWVTSLSLFTFMHWRRKWQPTPIFLPGESQGQRSLLGCPLWGRTELDMTDAT